MRKPPHGYGLVVFVLALALMLVPGARSAHADVQPGDKISAANVDKVTDLVSPGLEWCIRNGWPITVTETKPITWPGPYKEATEKYAGQVKIGPKGLEGYVAGLPFPTIDVNDPEVAVKIMWNYDYKFLVTDDVDSRNFDADTGSISTDRPMNVERHFLLDHFRRLYYTGRLYVDPKPVLPNKKGYRYKESLHPILEPFDLKGVGGLYYRYVDPAQQDDSWLYLPTLRRVRRLSTAQRSDALFGQDTDVDSYYGYSGHIAWMEWKFLGEKTVLGAMHGEHYPVKWADGAANWAFDDVWEKRDVYVIEGISKLPQYAFSKRIIFVDKEAWVVPYSDMYDRAGELWKIWVNLFSFKKQAFDSDDVTVYEDEMGFDPAIVMVDMQLVHATRASLPSHRFEGEEGWYFNMGDESGVTEDWFTIAHLIEAGK